MTVAELIMTLNQILPNIEITYVGHSGTAQAEVLIDGEFELGGVSYDGARREVGLLRLHDTNLEA